MVEVSGEVGGGGRREKEVEVEEGGRAGVNRKK